MLYLLYLLKVFIVIMQMGVFVGILWVVFSAVDYAQDSFYCNYDGIFLNSYVGDSFE